MYSVQCTPHSISQYCRQELRCRFPYGIRLSRAKLAQLMTTVQLPSLLYRYIFFAKKTDGFLLPVSEDDLLSLDLRMPVYQDFSVTAMHICCRFCGVESGIGPSFLVVSWIFFRIRNRPYTSYLPFCTKTVQKSVAKILWDCFACSYYCTVQYSIIVYP